MHTSSGSVTVGDRPRTGLGDVRKGMIRSVSFQFSQDGVSRSANLTSSKVRTCVT